MKAILNLIKEAKRETVTNAANPAEVMEEITLRKNLRYSVNFDGVVAGWSVKVTTDIRPGGHCVTVLKGWRWAA